MTRHENALFAWKQVAWCLVAVALAMVFGTGCATAPIKLECGEQRFRLENETLSEDQRRFAEEALNDCESRLSTAKTKDSTFIENLNQRFTPGDSL